MSTHIGAAPGEIASTVLMPGDPLRARWIAETFLDDASCYSEVRGMYGYTGTWQGRPVSVQGSGMGQPSLAIYVNELFRDYDVHVTPRWELSGGPGAACGQTCVQEYRSSRNIYYDSNLRGIVAEGVGFEPTVGLHPRRFSRPLP